MPSSIERLISVAELPRMWYLCAVMINSLYHNEPASVNRPRPWPWKDRPPRSFGRRFRRDNGRGGSAQPPRRVVLDGPASERVRVRRMPERARYDVETMNAILDEGLVCRLAT